MRLTFVEIRDYRSIFVDDAGQPLRMELAEGANTLVGQNNCGKSNVLRAISLALDPNHELCEEDTPGPRPFSHPIITLGFLGEASNSDDSAVLDAAKSYEQSLGLAGDATRASRGEIVLQVAFVPTPNGSRRSETLLTDGVATAQIGEIQDPLLLAALEALRESVRFVLISSGESIESVLEGNFKEILHSVVRDRLSEEFETAEQSRQHYIDGLQDSLLRPLRERLAVDVGGMFPEIDGIGLSPEVSTIETTLSNVGVSLDDLVSTPLAGKGTGVRGGVLVAMLSYLAVNATRGMVFAVEEPEAFLHPAAQEDLRDHLEQLAAASGVTLLVTTHSPFTVTRSPKGRVFCLAKDRDGRTRVSESASGDADHAPLIGGLLREASIEAILAAGTTLPVGTGALVLVEGEGDRFCMELAANVVGRPDLLEGLVLRPTGGTIRMIAEAVIARAAVDVPIVIVVDNDDAGREARNLLIGHKFKFEKNKVLSYADVFGGGQWSQFAVEAEDLFDPGLIQGFVDFHGHSIIEGSGKRPDGAFHYDFGQAAKETLNGWLTEETRPEHLIRWIEMLKLIRDRAGLSVPEETADKLVAAAPDPKQGGSDVSLEGEALIVTGALDYARYQAASALVLNSEQRLPDGVTHVGFYAKVIHPHLPAIVSDQPNLLFDPATAAQLRATGKASDLRLADIIDHTLGVSPDLAGQSRRVLLLSADSDDATIVLDQPVRNTKTLSDRPVAWAVGTKVVPVQALAASPATTDDLDAAIAALGEP